jgi:hypothetical protein
MNNYTADELVREYLQARAKFYSANNAAQSDGALRVMDRILDRAEKAGCDNELIRRVDERLTNCY